MSLILLVALAAALSRWAGPFLVRATWVTRAPRLAIAAWLVVSSAVVLSGLLAGLTMLMYWDRAHDLVQGVWHFCFDALLGRDNLGAQAIAVTGC